MEIIERKDSYGIIFSNIVILGGGKIKDVEGDLKTSNHKSAKIH